MGNLHLDYKKFIQLSSTSMNTFNLRALMIIFLGLLLVNYAQSLSKPATTKCAGKKGSCRRPIKMDECSADAEGKCTKACSCGLICSWKTCCEINCKRRPINMENHHHDGHRMRPIYMDCGSCRRMRKALLFLQDD